MVTKTLVGVFIGVFIGALGYELVQRSNPEIVVRIREKVAETMEDFFGTADDPSFDDPVDLEA